jgi:hypothetical protein
MVLSAAPVWAQGTPSAAPAPSAPATLHLTCEGLAAYAGPGGNPALAEGQVLVEVTGPAAGRIRLPDVLTPLLHNQTDAGWRAFDTLTAGDTEITGQITLNLFNKPSVVIDRVTGHLEVKSGAIPLFGGECRAYDSNTRRF